MRHAGKAALIKPWISPREKGVVFFSFEYQWLKILRHTDVRAFAERYTVVTAPTWSPPHHLVCFLFPKAFPGPVFSLISNEQDLEIFPRFAPNYVMVPLFASSWVNPAYYNVVPPEKKDIDLIMVANFGIYKRHVALFKALRDMPKTLRVVLVGQEQDGRTAATLRAEARCFGVAERFEVRCNVSNEELADSLARARVSTILSRREGSCVVVVESMFAGTPVGLLETAEIGSKHFINDQTGRLLRERTLGADLTDFIVNAGSYRPRQWAEQNLSCVRSTATLNEVVKKHALRTWPGVDAGRRAHVLAPGPAGGAGRRCPAPRAGAPRNAAAFRLARQPAAPQPHARPSAARQSTKLAALEKGVWTQNRKNSSALRANGERRRTINGSGERTHVQRRSCFRGHFWEADGKSGLAGFCPVCGAPAQPLLPPSAADAADDLESTIQESPGTGALPLLGGASEPLPTLPDFEILGELGRGGMGIVYKARELRKDRLVALKVIRKDRLQHEEAVRRFRREAQAASRLLHPNIVHVFDSDHSGSTHYLVMEFVDGMTLERLVELKGPLTLERACDFVRQTALGLQHAQDMALVHRDIKPTNLMVTPPPRDGTQRGGNGGLGYQIKILDMGVARVLQLGGQSPSESLSTLTHGGSVIGTADYIAPEQLEDPHGADIRADLYSLGCTFYFLLTGQVPFPGGSLVSKLDKQRWETPTSIHQLRDDVPPAVATLVQKLMAKKPAERFQTPADLVQALDELGRTGFSSSGCPHRRSRNGLACLDMPSRFGRPPLRPTASSWCRAARTGRCCSGTSAPGSACAIIPGTVKKFGQWPSLRRGTALFPRAAFRCAFGTPSPVRSCAA